MGDSATDDWKHHIRTYYMNSSGLEVWFQTRVGLREFLISIHSRYDIFIYTSATLDYATGILKMLIERDFHDRNEDMVRPESEVGELSANIHK